MSSLDWQELGVCNQIDPDLFFPNKGESPGRAKSICFTCDVRRECLEYALTNDERFGVWGGKSERERRAMQKRAAA